MAARTHAPRLGARSGHECRSCRTRARPAIYASLQTQPCAWTYLCTHMGRNRWGGEVNRTDISGMAGRPRKRAKAAIREALMSGEITPEEAEREIREIETTCWLWEITDSRVRARLQPAYMPALQREADRLSAQSGKQVSPWHVRRSLLLEWARSQP
jgi:hypothetical protein